MSRGSSTTWPIRQDLSGLRPGGAAVAAATPLLIAFAWLYADVIPALVRQWAADPDYSHGFFVVPLAVFFAWKRRVALAALPLRPHVAGLAVLLVSLGLFIAGRYGSELFLTRVSMVGVLAGLILFLVGPAHLRRLVLPIAFLLFMIPLPAIVFNYVAFPLQLLASRLGALVISATGVPVLREGNVLLLPGRSLEVAEACSGIRSLLSLLMLAIVLGTSPRGAPARARRLQSPPYR